MFPKSKINLIYRLLCLICFLIVIIVINSIKSLLIIFIIYSVFALCEKSFRNIELIVISLVILGLCYLFGNYWLFKIMMLIDYSFYFLDTGYYEEEIEPINKNDYLRFKIIHKKKKGLNNITAVYLTVHLGLLFIAILVG